MQKILTRLFVWELPEIADKYRWMFHVLAVALVVSAIAAFLATMHYYNVLVLPGEAGDVTFHYLKETLKGWESDPVLFWGFVASLVLLMAYRSLISLKGYFDFEKNIGRKLDLREMATFQTTNLLYVIYTPLLIALIAWVTGVFGIQGPHGESFQVYQYLMATGNALVTSVPTIFSMPRWLAFAVSYVFLVTFFHYWLHRLAHTRRALWLLLHRTHHLVEDMTQVNILPVVVNFPLWIFLLVPYTFIFGAATKLFYPEPLYQEFLLFWVIHLIVETWAHSAALYERGIKKRWVVFMSNFTGGGVHHVLHHSANSMAMRLVSTNTINIGPGVFFMWDRLFGTYQPLLEKLPALGLHGQPDIYKNPLRIMFAGISQLVYELYCNRSAVLWLRILFGSSDYVPPISRDFMIKEKSSVALGGQRVK